MPKERNDVENTNEKDEDWIDSDETEEGEIKENKTKGMPQWKEVEKINEHKDNTKRNEGKRQKIKEQERKEWEDERKERK